MKKYLVLYISTASAEEQMKNATPEQQKEGMQMWMSWAGKAGKAIVDLGSPVGNAMTATSAGGKKGGAMIGGFSILQAESDQAIAEVLKGHPHFMAPGASIEVHEFFPIPGM
jgi:hypothetical protein